MTFKVDPVRLADALRSAQGPVVRDLIRRGNRVRDRARELVGVSRGAFFSPGIERASETSGPHLRDAIVTRLVFEGDRFKVLVGSDLPYALYHHEGTRPHTIRARRSRRLVFFWPKAARVMFLPRVRHPGTRPNRYLTDALREAGGR